MSSNYFPLQSIVFPESNDIDTGLYYHSSLPVSSYESGILIPKGCLFSTDTYMNLFDGDFWSSHTGIRKCLLSVRISGSFTLSLIRRTYSSDSYHDELCFSQHFNDNQPVSSETGRLQTIQEPVENLSGYCFIKIEAHSDVRFQNAAFTASLETIPQLNSVNIAVNICTYNREKQVSANIELLKRSLFFQKNNPFSNHMDIFIIDNASSLSIPSDENIHFYFNKNTGGSGGFTRGLEEINRSSKSFSHVLFMDDDVEFTAESFYRLFSLLSCIRLEYLDYVVAGRMFRLDRKNVQYTACEIWNKGEIKHIGLKTDMSLPENLNNLNDSTQAEYGGWWFCCFPWSFARDNRPLPVFLHCDDVEDGLRHGGYPISLNGIQVWHETFEYRQAPVILYYDTRNPLFVNNRIGCLDLEAYHQTWKKNIAEYHNKCDYEREYMVIRGLFDFLKGERWLCRHDSTKLHRKLTGRKKCLRYRNALLWRITVTRLKSRI